MPGFYSLVRGRVSQSPKLRFQSLPALPRQERREDIEQDAGSRPANYQKRQARAKRLTVAIIFKRHANIMLAGNSPGLRIPKVTGVVPTLRVRHKRKRLPTFLLIAFINAGNDLRSHTLGACSTIGPAGLNFRVRDGNGWIPRGKITDKSELSALSRQQQCTRLTFSWPSDSKLVSALNRRLSRKAES
jgi:hypothetical protein